MHSLARLRGFIRWYFSEYVNKTGVEDLYDRLSRHGYDDIVGFDRRTPALKSLVSEFNFKNKTVLDLASGTGAFIQAVIDEEPKNVMGVDLTAGMLNVAKKRFKKYRNVSFINRSFMDVRFSKETFDYILLANASRYIPFGEEETFFSNVRRWLKPKGVFVILSDNVFGYSTIGRMLSRVVYGRLINKKLNPNTTADWALEKVLPAYFRIEKSVGVGWMGNMNLQHKAFFCTKKG